MTQLGKLVQEKDLRTVWKHEALNFTPWLVDNLDLLSDAVDIRIEPVERESAVGDFNVDIFAREEMTGRRIIIENQLEKSNHDHLGKIITYASGKDAEIVIWIVSEARDEHRQAIEWLNQHTDEKCAFFLIEIELWRIDDSRVAPKFNIVEKPNDWAKAMRSGSVTESDNLKLEFWTAFKEYAENDKEFSSLFTLQKPKPQYWCNIGLGLPYHISLVVSTQSPVIKAGIYEIPTDKDVYNKLRAQEQEVERLMGTKVDWRESEKTGSFFVCKDIDINERQNWPTVFNWFRNQSVKLKALSQEISPRLAMPTE